MKNLIKQVAQNKPAGKNHAYQVGYQAAIQQLTEIAKNKVIILIEAEDIKGILCDQPCESCDDPGYNNENECKNVGGWVKIEEQVMAELEKK